jgi:succinoglycan biosynthesis transport protein ExoP
MTPTTPDHPSSLRASPGGLVHLLRVLRRRRRLIAVVLVLVPIAAVAFSLTQRDLYQGSAKVLLNRQNLANALTGTPDATLQSAQVGAFSNYANTQAALVKAPTVATGVLKSLGLTDRTPRQLLDHTTVTPETNADFLDIAVTDANRGLATRLATAFAQQYTRYRLELDTSSLAKARAGLEARLRELRRQGERKSTLYQALQTKEGELQELAALQTSNATVVADGKRADQVQPRPVRNAILGLGLGLVLAIGLAFARDALDARIRSPDEAAEALELPLLAQIPAPPKSLRQSDQLVSLAEPGGPGAESFRVLRTGLAFARLSRTARTIMITSAVEGEGKSTTAANLAVTLARGGQRVVLVDCDFRRSSVWKFFGAHQQPGLTELVLGTASVADVTTRVPVSEHAGEPGSNGSVPGEWLAVVPAGSLPPNPGEFVGAPDLAPALAALAEDADTVILDAPPLLHVGDALALSPNVDALLVVVRLRRANRSTLREVHRLLGATPTRALGFVATDAEPETAYGYYAYTSTPALAGRREPSARG